MAKVFMGGWIDEKVRKKFKAVCAVHEVNGQDVLEQLMIRWMKSDHVMNEVKELINGRESE